jgi:hypothetical protein
VRRWLAFVLFLVFVGAVLAGVLLDDEQPLSGFLYAVGILAAVAAGVVSPDVRAGMAERFPRTAALGRRILALRWRWILGSLGVAIAALLLAEAWESAFYPRGDLREHLVDRYGEALHSERSPLLLSAEMDADWQPEDQRYTPVGVFLRYEKRIVALLPDGHGGTRIDVEDELDGFRRFHPYVGDFWGPSYSEKAGVPRSARAVPSEEDLRAAARELAEAREWQGVCFGWDVDVRSGRREGRLYRPIDPRCRRSVVLEGWVDPNARRFRRRGGDPGDWSLGYRWRLDGPIPEAAIDAIDTPKVELIEGATQQPRGEGSRAGKGLLEWIEAMPLLALETPGVSLVPPRTEHVAEGERPAPVQRSDSERRAEESWLAFPPALLRVGAVGLILFLLVTLPVALGLRLVRRLRRGGGETGARSAYERLQ